jgi:signal transduction histidine kinase/CheY-like chemotaxis protein
MGPNPSPAEAPPAAHERRKAQVYAEQVRLLYANTNAAVAVTVCVAGLLSYLQRPFIPLPMVTGWLLYILAISSARLVLSYRYRKAAVTEESAAYWGKAFTAGSSLSAIGWGAAGVLLFPEGQLSYQLLLAFVIGGMMLGAGSILASRPKAFFTFIVIAGLPLALRFLMQGDDVQHAMGLLALIFTAAILFTTANIYRMVRASLHLQLENNDLVAGLQDAKKHAETLNRELEIRVRDRTSELRQANERLRAEIEQRKQVEEELLRARKLDALGVLAGGIAHDFNNFLTVVQGNIGLAKLELEPASPVVEILDRTSAACQRAAALASQLLTFGKGGDPVRRIASIARLVQDSAELAQAGSNVVIETAIARDLRSAQVDASQVSHALHNILLNARQAMPDGGTIQVRAENVVPEPGSLPLVPGEYVRISVKDHGCGISQEHLPRVFDPYFTTKRAGNGLGLAAAYSIVAKHQGHITVESVAGAETTFSIYLPASSQAAATEPRPEEVLRSGTGRILVMDDEEAVRKLLMRILRHLGYEVACARDGVEAIALFEKALASGCGFDAALLDLTIPGGMGGLEAGARLREIDPPVKLVASSGYSDAPVMSDYCRYGFDDVIPKPWTPAQVSEVFTRVLSQRRRATPQGGTV